MDVSNVMKNTINQRIDALRQAMAQANVDAYIIPSSDPHQSEYVADHWKSRTWISDFSGSAGTVVITADHAGLWTDSRYFLQAEQELANSEMQLHKQVVQHAPEHIGWLADTLPAGSKVGCDGMLFSVGQIRAMAKAFHTKNIDIDTEVDLINHIWKDRPALPDDAIFEHDVRYAGQSRAQKMAAIRQQMKQTGASHYLVSTLDDIAWIFNLRGTDVEFNPVFIAYAIIGQADAQLFIDSNKVPSAVLKTLSADHISLKAYDSIKSYLEHLPTSANILIDRSSTSIQVYKAIALDQIVEGNNIGRNLKAIKNETETKYIRQAMLKDGVALTRLYRWLDRQLDTGGVTEVTIAEQLAEFRREQGDYHGESFAAIVGYKGNGAIIHYRPAPESCATLSRDGILLLDSGGQYTQGTTDITRTTALSDPTAEQKRHFTCVLKGHIALATIKFPEGTKGIQLDTLARQYLWQQGLNYGHGTGHGVGFFLNVHEPPQGFATSISPRGVTGHMPGMFSSNEPGYYKEGEYGIRIENLILARVAEENEHGRFLEFETLTLFPIDLNLIDYRMMEPHEISWLNQYHQEVFDKLSPLLEAEEVEWLREKCRAI